MSRRFITAMAGLTLIPITFLGVVLLDISERGIQSSVLELHTKLAEKWAESLQQYFKTVDDGVRFTMDAARKSGLEWTARQELLRSLIDSNPDIEEITVLDKKGKEQLKIYNPALGSSPELVLRGADPGFAEYLKTRSRTLWITPRPDQAPRIEYYLPLSPPLTLRVSMILNRLWTSVGNERLGGTGFAMVLDRRGRPILYPPERVSARLREALPKWPIVAQALTAVTIGSSEYSDLSGAPQVGAYAPVPALDGAVMIQQPKAEAFVAASRMRRTLLVVFVAVGAGAVLVALWLADRLSRPVLALTRGASEVAHGRFPEPVEIRTGDELQGLAETFNHMVSQMRRYAEMQVDRLVEAQRKTEAILFSIDDGILMADDDGVILLANRRAREILGVGPAAPLEGRRLTEALPDSPLRAAVLAASAETGKEPGPEGWMPKEVEISTDQSRRFVRVSARPVVSPRQSAKVGVVAALRDVTLEKQLDKMKEEFLHSITHDLRNPVGSVIGFSEFLLKGAVGVLNTQQANMVGSIEKAASRLLAMVNNILDAAKMETGRVEVKLAEISLAAVARHSLDVLGALAQRRGIKMELESVEAFSVRADGDLLERVFTNLVGNALKFAQDDGKVTVSLTDDGDHVRACVADDGEGIPPAYKDKIFEKFEQVPGQRRGGTGLGLTICKHIVEAHLGRVWVESELGQGARFYFTVPKDLAPGSEAVVRQGRGGKKEAPAS